MSPCHDYGDPTFPETSTRRTGIKSLEFPLRTVLLFFTMHKQKHNQENQNRKKLKWYSKQRGGIGLVSPPPKH